MNDTASSAVAAVITPAAPSGTTPNDYRRGQAWWAVIVLMMLQTVSLVDRNILSIMVIEIRADMGLNDFQISLLTGLAFSAFYCVAGLFIGSLVDRYSIRKILYFSVTIWSLAAAATGLARTYWGMACARMITGAGEGGVNPGGQALIAASFPRDRASLPMSLFATSGTLGIGLSYFGGGLLLEAITSRSIPGLESLAPWRQVLIVTGLPGLLIALLAFTVREPGVDRDKVKTASATTWRAFGIFLATERLLYGRLGLSVALIAAINYGMASWAPTYGRRVLDLSPSEVGTLMGLILMVVGPPAAALYGYMVDRQVARGRSDFALSAFAIAALLALPLFIVGFVIDSSIGFIAALILAQCTLFSVFGPTFAAIMVATPVAMRGRMAALILFVINLGGYAGGPIVIGALTDFVLRDPQKVGIAIALLGVCIAPIAAWSVWSVRSHFVARLARAQS